VLSRVLFLINLLLAKLYVRAYLIQKGLINLKYGSNNKPLVCLQTQSTCYKETQKMVIKGILWHSTGVNNPNLKRHIQPSDKKPKEDSYSKEKWLKVLGKNKYNNDWNHINQKAGVNCWIGKLINGTVTTVQTLPWDFRPWGCGRGNKGSCNDGWIQLEICEDNLNNKDYFNKVYKEACEITAYLCKLYNINPKGIVLHNGIKVPTILCHQDSYKLGLGSNHTDIYHWFNKYDKNMATVRTDVEKLIKEITSKKLYRVRKDKNDSKSQIGAFYSLSNAKTACKKAGAEYKVFDWNWTIVYLNKTN
jgi:hypothetical protein